VPGFPPASLIVPICAVLVYLDLHRSHEHLPHATLGSSPAWSIALGESTFDRAFRLEKEKLPSKLMVRFKGVAGRPFDVGQADVRLLDGRKQRIHFAAYRLEYSGRGSAPREDASNPRIRASRRWARPPWAR
jgi:hypothetical protein